MTQTGCAREPELLALLRGGRWPAGCDEELRAHVATCEPCGELLQVASAALEDRNVLGEAPLPGSGLVWWRMQLRLRAEAARASRRALLLVQVLSVSITFGIALALLRSVVPDWASKLARALPVSLDSAAPILLALLAGLALVGARAAYLATRNR